MAEIVEDNVGFQVHRQPKWFTPQKVLALFSSINFLNYLDQGTIASNAVNGLPKDPSCKISEICFHGSGIQGEFGLNYFQDGILSSAFMVGLLSSFVFAHLSKRLNLFRLIGVGLLVWVFATAGCAISTRFWLIIIFRMLVGVGEASIVTLAPLYILDIAPLSESSLWLSIFYMFIPIGVASGYIYGGLVGGALGWRATFWIESLFMLPFAIFGFVSDQIYLKDEVHSSLYEPLVGNDVHEKAITFFLVGMLNEIKELAMSKVYMTNVLGYVVYSFVIGAYVYWGPKASQAIFNMRNADEVFGRVTILAGIVGTYCSGLFLDYIGSSLQNSFKLLAVATIVGATCCITAFMSHNFIVFISLFAIGEFFFFATQGPVNSLSLNSVSPNLQQFAMATSTNVVHFFGDAPSTLIVGLFQDRVQNWRLTIITLTLVFYLTATIWGSGVYFLGLNNKTCETKNSQEATLLPEV